jgi:hypothetical protein
MSKAVESFREWRKRQRDEGKRPLTLWLEGETLDRLHAQVQAFGLTVPELIARLSEQLLQGNTRLEGLHEQRVALKAEKARLEARIQALLDRYPPSPELKSVAES